MTTVDILYNPFNGRSQIHIDGRAADNVTTLSRFQTQPFYRWYRDLLPAIANEVNDRFALRLQARVAEGLLLQPMVSTCPDCVSYQRSDPPLGDTALRRLKKLSQMITTGTIPACPRQSFAVYVCCADPAAVETALDLKAILPRLAFCRPTLHVVLPGQPLPAGTDAAVWLIGPGEEAPDRPPAPREGAQAVFMLGSDAAVSYTGGYYRCGVSALADLNRQLVEYLEFLPFVDLLRRTLESYSDEALGIHRTAVRALDAVAPVLVVEPVTLLELGQTQSLKIGAYPPGSAVPPYRIHTSTGGVVTVEGDRLTGEGLGKCYVTVEQLGLQTPAAQFQITVLQRNRITKITAGQEFIHTEVGRAEHLSYTFEPANADNVSKVRYISTRPEIAAVDARGGIRPLCPGTTNILIEAEAVRAKCQVTVHPRLEALVTDPPELQLRVGETGHFRVSRLPEGALDEPVRMQHTATQIAAVDLYSGIVEAKDAGSCVVEFISADGRIKGQLSLQVAPQKKSFWQKIFD